MKKIYKSENGIQYTFPVTSDARTAWVELKGCDRAFATDVEWIQRCIEESKLFRDGVISVQPANTPEDGDVKDGKETKAGRRKKESGGAGAKEYPDIIDASGAIRLLTSAPFSVPQTALLTPDDIKRHAAANGIIMPNLNI
jgi:hypothetical protein